MQQQNKKKMNNNEGLTMENPLNYTYQILNNFCQGFNATSFYQRHEGIKRDFYYLIFRICKNYVNNVK